MRTLILIFTLLFFITGCSKQLTVKSLHPSSITDRKIKDVILEEFENDNINQANYLEEAVVNKTVDGKRVFRLKPTYEYIDAIITGKVLESSLILDKYYEDEIDYDVCKKYEYKDGKKIKCLEHKKRFYPCEKRDYKVRTQIQVLDSNEHLLFSKVYTKTKHDNKCFKTRDYYYSSFSINRNKYEINSQLAKDIAITAINELSPHYSFQKITIIDELEKENPLYTKMQKEEFEKVVELLDEGYLEAAKNILYKLDKDLDGKSYEVLYNLALIYEARDTLHTARSLYEESKRVCKNIDDLKKINQALRRVDRNISNKQITLKQLD